MKKIDMQRNAGISGNILARMGRKEYISMEKVIIGGLQEKKDHVDQIQKCFMIQENQHVDQNVSLHVNVVNM